ncbi:hypothetical protein OC846_001946 [Tilletia horrida]|uniref:Uncharacterized protein n=1 Tax=Tilletia horrida TaxID=155126 RepID=A0AAN6GSZ8_9BASI|nr:hypothetical protein OC845_002042 [Tilletia horrida]KAK0554843.1 hypothetical protein OC846_001946 [Tilletia horrida]KAK0568189.1 hypothetical protein OC861_002208 [Tilletia horrida]
MSSTQAGPSNAAGAAQNPSPLGPSSASSSIAPAAAPAPGALPFRPNTARAPFKTDVVRRSALSTATLLRTSKPGVHGPGGLASNATGLLGTDEDDEENAQLSEAQLAKLEENVNVKIDNDIQVLLDGFRQLVGLSMIRDKDRYLLAQESYQAEMRAHNMVRAAQSLTLLSASLKLSLILALEPEYQQGGNEVPPSTSSRSEGQTQPSSARELVEDTERLRQRCAHLLGGLGIGLGNLAQDQEDNEEEEVADVAMGSQEHDALFDTLSQSMPG